MISRLHGKYLRKLVESRGLRLAERLDMRSRSLAWRFEAISWFTLQTSNYDARYRFLCRYNVIDDVIQKVQCHDDLIKVHVVR